MADKIGIQDGVLYIAGIALTGEGPAIQNIECIESDVDIGEAIGDADLAEKIFGPKSPVSRRRQAIISLENGWKISIVWGNGAHCVNHSRGIHNNEPFIETPSSAEVAIISYEGHWLDIDTYSITGESTSKGWVTANEILNLMSDVALLDSPAAMALAHEYPSPPDPWQTDNYYDLEGFREDIPDEDF